MKPEILHLTILMLPLGVEHTGRGRAEPDEQKVEACRLVMKKLEPEILSLIQKHGVDGRLRLKFDGLEYFGRPQRTRLIFMKMKDDDQLALLRDIIHLMVSSCLENNILKHDDLTHVSFDKSTGRYTLDRIHLSLVNSAWAAHNLRRVHGRRDFIGKEMIREDFDLTLPDVTAETLELSTRYEYNENSGMYQS